MTRYALLLTAVGCSSVEADWTLDVWGEDYIARGIPETSFEDGCRASFERFEVGLGRWALRDGAGIIAESTTSEVYDLVRDEPQRVDRARLSSGVIELLEVELSARDRPVVRAVGTLTCGDRVVEFDWSFWEGAEYSCELGGVLAGELVASELTIHGDHLFYDHLADPHAAVRGLAIVEADQDADGVVTEAELRAVPLATLGYGVGSSADVLDLWGFIQRSVTTVGHLDGEGHCEVSLTPAVAPS